MYQFIKKTYEILWGVKKKGRGRYEGFFSTFDKAEEWRREKSNSSKLRTKPIKTNEIRPRTIVFVDNADAMYEWRLSRGLYSDSDSDSDETDENQEPNKESIE
jgi:hypothetical protein